MSKEKQSYNIFRKNIIERGDRIHRVENMAGAGMPDVNYCIDGVEGWIEMKAPVEPKRMTSILFSNNNSHKLTQTQMNWFLEQKNAGGLAFIFVTTQKRIMLFHRDMADYINSLSVEELIGRALWHRERPLKKTDWYACRMILSKQYFFNENHIKKLVEAMHINFLNHKGNVISESINKQEIIRLLRLSLTQYEMIKELKR